MALAKINRLQVSDISRSLRYSGGSMYAGACEPAILANAGTQADVDGLINIVLIWTASPMQTSLMQRETASKRLLEPRARLSQWLSVSVKLRTPRSASWPPQGVSVPLPLLTFHCQPGRNRRRVPEDKEGASHLAIQPLLPPLIPLPGAGPSPSFPCHPVRTPSISAVSSPPFLSASQQSSP